MIHENEIKRLAPPSVYKKGYNYYLGKRVEITRLAQFQVSALVYSTGEYQVEVAYDPITRRLKTHCDCSTFENCEHIIATLLTIIKNQRLQNMVFGNLDRFSPEGVELTRGTYWRKFYSIREDLVRKELVDKSKPEYKLIFVLNLEDEIWTITPQVHFIKRDGSLGKQVPLTKNMLSNSVTEISYEERLFLYSVLHHRLWEDLEGHLTLYGAYASDQGQVLLLLRNSLIYTDRELQNRVYFQRDKISLCGEVERVEKGYELNLQVCEEHLSTRIPLTHGYRILTVNPLILYRANRLYVTDQTFPVPLLKPLLFTSLPLFIPEIETEEFFRTLYFELSSRCDIQLPEDLKVNRISELLKKRLYLYEEWGDLRIELKFVYGEEGYEVPDEPFIKHQFFHKEGRYSFVERQERIEELSRKLLQECDLYRGKKGWYISNKVERLDWLFGTLPRLVEMGFEIRGEEQLKTLRINREEPVIKTNVSSGIDWFDLNVEIHFGSSKITLKQLLKQLRKSKKTKYIKLSDGSFVRLDPGILKRIGLIGNIAQSDPGSDVMRIPRYSVGMLEELLNLSSEVEADDNFREHLERLKEFDRISEVKPSANFKGKLRKYQEYGLNWLYFLNRFGFGGCLADDMGLGKTIQVLALLQLLHEKEKHTSLIVVPTSVIFNWIREIQRFTPNLKVFNYSGVDREKSTRRFHNYDIVLTTYAILWRDHEILSQYEFFYIILDESQKIKNPHSLTARCARKMKGRYRLVLSGTPIENNTLELWSQMSFLNPGMLGSLERFQETFSHAIEKKNDREVQEYLRKLIYPFILRRTKQEVEKDLPDKVENVIYCEMTPGQRDLYNQWRDYYRRYLIERIESGGIRKARLKILEGLTKLRQIAIHPGLVDEKYKRASGKFDVLTSNILEILQERHKILIFSQFVRMLSFVREFLDEEQIPYCYLDGRTRNRAAEIDRFQKDEQMRVFLISLKAGGVGLNLTAADYVIHIDPWWNPAVEEQATDRAHRIGQTKKVFVYKLITVDSVEQKIQQLQEKKRLLAQQLITMDTSIFKRLTREDIEILFE